MKGGIKPVAKPSAGAGGAGAAPTAGRRAGGAAGAGVRGGPVKGSKAALPAAALAPAREPAISAAHLLSLLGPSGGAELRGMFSAQDGRSQPVHNPRIHEFAPLTQAGNRRGRRGSEPKEDIITGAIKQHQSQQQQQPQNSFAPQRDQQQQRGGYDRDRDYPPALQSQQSAPHGSFVHQQDYNSRGGGGMAPGMARHSSAGAIPSASSAAAVAAAAARATPISPVAANRARAMGSTIFNPLQQEDDLPSSTITGHFRGRVNSAAPVKSQQPPPQPQQQESSYIQQSSMMNRNDAQPRRQQPIPNGAYNANGSYARGGDRDRGGYGGVDNNRGPPPRDSRDDGWNEHKSNAHANPNFPPNRLGDRERDRDRDPYARQSQHQNPYDTRDPSLHTQRDRERAGNYNQSRSPSRGPPRGGGYADDYNDPSYEPSHRDRDYRGDGGRGGGGGGGGGGRDSASSFHHASAAHSTYPSPPHSPSASQPRHSWGGGDVSQFEDGSVGARDANRRKKDEMRAILDAQIAEKQAQGGGGAGGGIKSTKYALRHRERQAELAAEQNRLGLGAGAGNGGRDSPHSFHNSPHQQQQGGFNHPQQQQQYSNNQGYDQHSNAPPAAPFSPSSHSSHSRVRSDLHAGVDSSAEGLTEKQRAQLEFRRQLAEQVREKEHAKASAKSQKEEEDRRERIRLGLAPDPRRPHVDIPGLGREYGSGQQQPQQFGSQGLQQGAPHSMPLSPGHGGLGAGGGLSPSKLAENRNRAMSSNVFAGEAETPFERKERERQLQVESIAEQIAEKARIKKEIAEREAEMDAKDEARLARDRLELPFRLQGMDPMAAAEKASAILRAQEEAKRAQEEERNGVHNHHQHADQRGNERERGGMVSPGHAKTVLAADRDRERDRDRDNRSRHQQHQPEFEDDSGRGGGAGEDDDETESHIAKLTALTSAMNKKVESRRRKAQQFEDSGLIDEAGDSRADLDEYEEVPRRVSGVTVAGRRGGKQGPSNKAAAAGSKKGAAAAAAAAPSKSRARSAARGSKSASRNSSPKRDSRSTKKPSAAERERDQEAKVLAAANERKARILARARKEAGEDSGDGEEETESERRSRRSSARVPRAAGGSRKPAASVGARARKPRVSSASASVLRRHGVEIDPEDGDDVEVELYPDDGTNIDNSARGAGPYGGQHGGAAHSPVRSRIPAPRVQSGKRRKPLITGGQIVPQHEHYSPHHHQQQHPHHAAAAAYTHGGGGSAYHSPMHSQQHHYTQQQQQPYMHHPHQPYTDHFSNQPVGVHAHATMGAGGFMSSQVHGGGSRGHSTVTSPSRAGQNHPIYSAYGSSSSSSLLGQAQGQGPQRSVNPSEYPWFASASAAGAGLDTSLSGNSAFILLPSSSSSHMPPITAASAGPSTQASRAPSSLAQHGGAMQHQQQASEEDGILPDELDKLMQHYGQTVGLDQVFDSNILPVAAQPVVVAARPASQQQQQKAPTPAPSAVPVTAASKQASRQPSAAGLRPASVAAGAVSNVTPRPESSAAGAAATGAVASPAVTRPSTVSLQVLEVESFPLCSLCEETDAAIQCSTCDVAYCGRCAREYHAPKKLASHVLLRMQMQHSGGGGLGGSNGGAAAEPDENYEDDTDATAAAPADDVLSPLSPGGASLEMGSHEWLAGSLIEQSSGGLAGPGAQPAQTEAEAGGPASRALSPNPTSAAAGSQGMAHSGSRSQLARPQPRVVDPFSGLQ